MTLKALLVFPMLLFLCNPTVTADVASMATAGHALAKDRCGSCHGVEKDGVSPLQSAPLFRTLGQHYPLENLEEALAEGIFADHPDMPDAPWDPADIQRLIAYLKTIQTK